MTDDNGHRMYVTRRRIQDYIQQQWICNGQRDFTGNPRAYEVVNDVMDRYQLDKKDKDTIKSKFKKKNMNCTTFFMKYVFVCKAEKLSHNEIAKLIEFFYYFRIYNLFAVPESTIP